jgi:two-component system phosphate regulon response regulator PhoB
MADLQPSVLVVEDEPAQREVLAYNLESEGFRVIKAADGNEALLLIEEEQPDLILLDWMLPGTSGIEICRQIKSRPAFRMTPVIMLSARSEEVDKVRKPVPMITSASLIRLSNFWHGSRRICAGRAPPRWAKG